MGLTSQDMAIWTKCADSTTLLPTSDTLLNTDYNEKESQTPQIVETGALYEDLWWIWIIIALFFLGPLLIVLIHKRKQEIDAIDLMNTQIKRTNYNVSDDDDCSEEDSEGKQIERWAKETEYIPNKKTKKTLHSD